MYNSNKTELALLFWSVEVYKVRNKSLMSIFYIKSVHCIQDVDVCQFCQTQSIDYLYVRRIGLIYKNYYYATVVKCESRTVWCTTHNLSELETELHIDWQRTCRPKVRYFYRFSLIVKSRNATYRNKCITSVVQLSCMRQVRGGWLMLWANTDKM